MKRNLARKLLVATVVFSAIAGSMVFVSNSDSAEKVITLQYSNYLPPTHKKSVLIGEWCREVEKRSNGRVKIVHHPGATLTPAAQTYDSVMQGIADIGMTTPAYTRGRFPLTDVTNLPLGTKTALLGTKMANAYYEKFRPKEFDGVKMLYLFCHGPGIVHTKKAVNKLEDLSGAKIRTFGVVSNIMSALGATPVSMPMTEAYDALQKGIVDGIACPYEALEGWRFGEVIKYSIENFGSSYEGTFAVFMNKEKFNSLPKDVRAIIEKVSEEWIEKTGKLFDDLDTEGKKYAQSQGVQIITLSNAEDQRWAKQLDA